MTATAESSYPEISRAAPGLSVSRRSRLAVFRALVRNPLTAFPPEVYEEPLVYSHFSGRHRLYVTDPELVQDVLVRNAGKVTKGEDVRRALGQALGEGLLTAEGQHWRWQRQSVAPAFRHDEILGLLPAMIDAAGRTADRWRADGPESTVDIGHEMMRTTFDIITETMLSGRAGLDIARVERGISDYLEPTGWIFALSLMRAPEWLPYPGRRKATAAITYLRSVIGRTVKARRALSGDDRDLVDMLIRAKDPETSREMTDGEIVDNLLTFVTAGHETTALGLAWTFHLLAGHPDIEEEVVAEIDAITGGGAVEASHVPALVRTRQVFQEAMRLFPPAPILTRTAVESFELGGFTVPAGAVLYVPIYALHRHRKLWDDPEAFDPDRFLPAASKSRHRYAYMPFGAGPRVCIGNTFAALEAVAILAVLLKAFRLTRRTELPPVPTVKVTLRPERRIEMAVAER